eukprot:CAMPEP_0175911360 /NCGR_PEP_ID=MMETSP0108-20121206/8153_1 /TAXON_ID=195067 ORGANISM="Goniomonas pacifica, Strain CCMP1869" /NCGR_SAMPLE_ID=MMETSP0108 /ASSEMBLY_ACC=CAM_ASM_000204 /LENGTH=114 /DNA_ID=CAMNT_0017233603 /DNA_START=157 /DNA_END=497 /DNA_ORIENTATION=+
MRVLCSISRLALSNRTNAAWICIFRSSPTTLCTCCSSGCSSCASFATRDPTFTLYLLDVKLPFKTNGVSSSTRTGRPRLVERRDGVSGNGMHNSAGLSPDQLSPVAAPPTIAPP